MRLTAPCHMPPVALVDIHGSSIKFAPGRKMLLSLFREATCPFCNFRIYELSNNHAELSESGLDMVAVFKSTTEDVQHFIAKRPRPFRMVADPGGAVHQMFSLRSSLLGKLKAMILRPLTMMRGLGQVGMRGMLTGNLLPADFLIDEWGTIVETYYGEDIGDHIPMERIRQFVAGT